ncbi:phosphoribosyl-ATP diphosphatase [Eilatimonas milleporae]|uniref:Phosphoribosyl-ATP pyrophosphatase n=1 Tax=Eilatimonas milleporae TaxID=911205 RepID=A0A3M0BXN1_9PROT|nr:phosphoribosyl-ATP diphosphatase [Eilatimonas milleporae]RMB01792.1 phosphoribosyl-ATP pyrophosphatase [Eilatimonas milleporae]
MSDTDTLTVLHRLSDLLKQRRTADPEKSYVARLYSRGTAKIAQKVGEEAVELAIAAVQGDRDDIRGEAADLLFHLMVLLEDADLGLDDVAAELAARENLSGLEEKRRRTP